MVRATILCLALLVAQVAVADSKVGDKVYYKESAVAKIGNTVLDKYEVLEWPAVVQKVDGQWLWLGRAYVHKNDVMNLQNAFDACAEEVRKTPTSSRAWCKRAVCWREMGDMNSALKDIDEAIRLSPSDGYYYGVRGAIKYNSGNVAGAITDYDKAIELASGKIADYQNRGVAKAKLQDLDGAIRDFDEVIKLDSKFPAAYSSRGLARFNSGNSAGALADFDQAIRLNPNSAALHTNRGFIFHTLGKYPQAVTDYRLAIELAPNDASAKNNLSFLYATASNEKIRDGKQALELSERVLKQDPNNAYAKNSKACALALLGNFDDAIQLQNQSLQNSDFANDKMIYGGDAAKERLAAWKEQKLWFTNPK